MKRRIHLMAGVALIAMIGCVFWRWRTPHRIVTLPTSHVATPIETKSVADASTPPPKPAKFFKFSSNLATSSEEKALLNWWMYMDKHDPDFQWKTPIDFYGRVVNQHGQSVADAKVSMIWSAIGKTPELKSFTDNEGRFQITGIQGKGISVIISAPGYKGGAASNQSFEYSEFWQPHFHVPDKNNPVLFRLWKFEDAEPMYFWNKLKKLTVDGQKVWFDTKSGKFGASGDVAFSTKRGATYAPRQFDWSLLIEAAPGGGVALSKEELMFEAPEGGYEPSWTQDIGGKDASYTISKGVNFYLKTPDGKYAAIKAEIGHMTIPEGEVNLSAYVNPSGSRNLQYDAKKRLAPK